LGEADVWVLDGGDCAVGIESTVVDVSGATPVLLRPGGISRAALEQELGVPVSVAVQAARDDEARAAPGMLRKHYAPQALVRLVPHGQATLLRATALQLAAEHGVAMQRIAVLASHATLQQADLQDCVQLVASADPVVYARELYAHLHSVDERGCQVLVLESVPALTAWDAVRDRLQRAAAQTEAT
jgi:L-threonylcarbamoyladenylate synthase